MAKVSPWTVMFEVFWSVIIPALKFAMLAESTVKPGNRQTEPGGQFCLRALDPLRIVGRAVDIDRALQVTGIDGERDSTHAPSLVSFAN